MENYETMNVSIKGIETKESKNGRTYYSVDTDKGKMTCFESDILQELKKCFSEGLKCEISVAKSNGFKNIRQFISVTNKEVKPEDAFKDDKFKETRAMKDQSIYTSYAKDLVISGMDIDEAIDTVRKIREAFK